MTSFVQPNIFPDNVTSRVEISIIVSGLPGGPVFKVCAGTTLRRFLEMKGLGAAGNHVVKLNGEDPGRGDQPLGAGDRISLVQVEFPPRMVTVDFATTRTGLTAERVPVPEGTTVAAFRANYADRVPGDGEVAVTLSTRFEPKPETPAEVVDHVLRDGDVVRLFRRPATV